MPTGPSAGNPLPPSHTHYRPGPLTITDTDKGRTGICRHMPPTHKRNSNHSMQKADEKTRTSTNTATDRRFSGHVCMKSEYYA